MSPKLNRYIVVLALLALPALSACNTGGGAMAGVNEGMHTAGEGEGISGEGTSGPIQQEEEGSPGGAIGAAEDEQGASDAATMGTGGTGGAAQ